MADTGIRLSGATRVHFIVGDPIAQVKSPHGVTQAFQARGLQAVVVPAHVAPNDVADWLRGVSHMKNVDGVIVTVPHKFASAALCATLSDRAAFLGAVNALRRTADGCWHGDMFDGLGCMQALRAHSCDPAGRRALLVGAGGAGTAIAHALVLAGVAQLAVHDGDAARRDALVGRLTGLSRCLVAAGSDDPAGFDLVVNASPAGMRVDDPLPVQTERLAPGTFVACAVTQPAITPLIAAARARGLGTSTGNDMFACVRDLMVDFLAEAAA